jgi:hypothetical protein
VPNRTMKSALVVAGAAAGVAAAANWLGKKRHLKAVKARPEALATPAERESGLQQVSPRESLRESMIEPDSAELPVGRSADPEIDASLSHGASPDETSGASLLAEYDSGRRSSDIDLALDDVWSSTPGIAEPEQSEGYDAVLPEDLGTVWIQRATQTTHEDRPHASDPSDLPQLDGLISQASLASSGALDEQDLDAEDFDAEDFDGAHLDEEEIAEDDLDEVDNGDATEKPRGG